MVSALTLGVSRTGPAPELEVDGPGGVRHLLIAGTTGSGKGSWLQSVLGAAAPRADVQVCMIDPKALDSAAWAPRLAALAVDDLSIHNLSQRVAATLLERRHEAAARGWQAWEPTPERPVILLVVDELARAIKVPSFAELLDLVLHVGRALGVGVVCATQQANAKVVASTELRSLFTCRAALFDAEAAGYVFLYGKDVVSRYMPDAFGWLRYDRPGLAAWSNGTGAPWLARAYQWTRQDVARVVDATRHLAVDIDDLLARPVAA